MSNSTDHPWDHINIAGFSTPELPNQGYRVWIALVVMIISSGLFVSARVATRIVARQMGSDDYVILASLVNSTVDCKSSHSYTDLRPGKLSDSDDTMGVEREDW